MGRVTAKTKHTATEEANPFAIEVGQEYYMLSVQPLQR